MPSITPHNIFTKLNIQEMHTAPREDENNKGQIATHETKNMYAQGNNKEK